MIKPKQYTKEYWDWGECLCYIKEKYKEKEGDDDWEDFSQCIDEYLFFSPYDGKDFFILDKTTLKEREEDVPLWAKKILEHFFDEFGEGKYKDCEFFKEQNG